MPAEGSYARGDTLDDLEVGRAAEMRNEIEAGAAHAVRVQAFEFGVGYVTADHRDAADRFVRGCDRIEHRAVVGAVATRLHYHRTRETQKHVQSREHLPWRVGRRVTAVRRVRKFRRGAEHVAMRIACAGRQLVLGLDWIGVGGKDGFHRVRMIAEAGYPCWLAWRRQQKR